MHFFKFFLKLFAVISLTYPHHDVRFFCFIPVTLKSLGYYVIPPCKICVLVSIYMTVCPSISALFLLSRTSFKLCSLESSCLGLQVGKICQITTELWPLIDVQIAFSLSVLSIFDRFSSSFVKELTLGRSGLGLQMGNFCQIKTCIVVMACDCLKTE